MVALGIIGNNFEKRKKEPPIIIILIFVIIIGVMLFLLIKYSFPTTIDNNWKPYKERIDNLCQALTPIYSEQFASGNDGNHRIDKFIPIFLIDKHGFISEDEISKMDYLAFNQVACVTSWYDLTGMVYGLKGINFNIEEGLQAAVITWGIQIYDISSEQIIAQTIIIGPKPPEYFQPESGFEETIKGCSCYGITPIGQFNEWFDSLPILY